MKTLLDRLHVRLGDFWWYSLMLFAALRFGDLINAFVGLWLVPKYVPSEELGAVLPLTQFATMSFLMFIMTVSYKTNGENIVFNDWKREKCKSK